MKPNNKHDVRTFDLRLARTGAPICMVVGEIPTNIYFGANKIFGVMLHNDEEVGIKWDLNGAPMDWGINCSLVMAPIAYCQGKPVFTGDVLVRIDKNKEQLIVNHNQSTDFIEVSCEWPISMPGCTMDISNLIINDSKKYAEGVIYHLLTTDLDSVIKWLWDNHESKMHRKPLNFPELINLFELQALGDHSLNLTKVNNCMYSSDKEVYLVKSVEDEFRKFVKDYYGVK